MIIPDTGVLMSRQSGCMVTRKWCPGGTRWRSVSLRIFCCGNSGYCN